KVEALGGNCARDHVDVLDALAILRHVVSGEQRRQHLRDVVWGQPERAGAVLIDFEPDRLLLLAPVEVRIDHVGIFRHDGAHLIGDYTHLHGIGTDDAKLDRKTNRRAEIETIDACSPSWCREAFYVRKPGRRSLAYEFDHRSQRWLSCRPKERRPTAPHR